MRPNSNNGQPHQTAAMFKADWASGLQGIRDATAETRALLHAGLKRQWGDDFVPPDEDAVNVESPTTFSVTHNHGQNLGPALAAATLVGAGLIAAALLWPKPTGNSAVVTQPPGATSPTQPTPPVTPPTTQPVTPPANPPVTPPVNTGPTDFGDYDIYPGKPGTVK